MIKFGLLLFARSKNFHLDSIEADICKLQPVLSLKFLCVLVALALQFPPSRSLALVEDW